MALDFASYLSSGDDWSPVPVSEFVQAPWGINFTPFPTQIFLLKLLFGEELDNKKKVIKPRDMLGKKSYGPFTEVEYLKFLYEEGRSSLKRQEDELRTLIWNGGRKSTKSTVVSLALTYALYRFMSHYDPYEFFGLPEDTSIGCTNLASAEDQATVVFTNVQAAILNSPYFRPLLAREPTSSKIFLFTRKQRDRKQGLNGFTPDKLVKPSIVVSITVSTESGARGPNNFMLVFDEFAFFDLAGKSSQKIYKAIHPSIAAFGMYAKTLMISSPASKTGKFYEMSQKALESKAGDILYLETPTAEFNPKVDSAFLESEYKDDPQMFLVEYGANWEGAEHKYLDENIIEALVDHQPRAYPPIEYKHVPYYVGIDVGLENDGVVYAVAHAENDVVVVDNIVWFYPDYDSYAGYEELPLLKDTEHGKIGVVHDLRIFTKPFPVKGALTDQWNGSGLATLSELEGMPWVTAEHFTPKSNWQVAEVFSRLARENRIKLPDIPEVIENLKELKKKLGKKNAEGKRMYQVYAPEKSKQDSDSPLVGHDDVYSAVSRAVWLVYTKEIETGKAMARERQKAAKKLPRPQGNRGQMIERSTKMERLKRQQGAKRVAAVRRRR